MSTVRTSDPFKKTPCYFIWIGPPSEIDEDELKIVGHDVDGVLKFAQCAENPITFYCLDKYVDYYKALFEKKGCNNIKVQSVQSLLNECYESKDEYLSKKVTPVVKPIFEVTLNRKVIKDFNNLKKRDLVTIKEFVSLLLLYMKGGFTLDSNIKPLEMKPFYLPEDKDLRTPLRFSDQRRDVWMMYAPEKNKKVIAALDSFLLDWQDSELLFEEGSISEGASLISGAIMGGIVVALGEVSDLKGEVNNENNPWAWINQGKVNTLPLLNISKTYENTHKNAYQRASLIINSKDWERPVEDRYQIATEDRKAIFIKAIETKNLNALRYISEEKTELSPLIKVALQLFQKNNPYDSSILLMEKLMSLILEAKLDGLKEIENLIEQAFLWAIDFNAKEFKDYLTFRHCSVKVEENPIMRLTDKHLMTVLKLSRAQRKKIFWEKESSEESESNSKKLGRNS